MSVSVVVSNLNGARFLPRLLDTLRAQRGVTAEIIVVDRRSRDESRTILDQQPDVRVIVEPPETGLVAGYARGAAIAGHEHLFFCNEDMWFDPDCLRLLEERIDLPKRIGSADPWQWTYDERILIHGGMRFRACRWTPLSPYPFRINAFTESLPAGTDIPFPGAGALMIHRDVYREIGGWDAGFFLDYEDTDMFLRAWQRGWRSVTVPGAKVYHAVNASAAHSLDAVKQTVSKRRYISGRASVSVIGLKYFSAARLWMPVASWIATTFSHLARLRLRLVYWDLLALLEIGRRLGAARAFRRANRAFNAATPGERFFTLEAFNVRGVRL
jgi:GT2 family glycosyltransferase